MVESWVQSQNTAFPSEVIELGRTIEVRPDPRKAKSPIVVIELERVTEESWAHSSNAPYPREFIELGRTIEVRPDPRKA